MCPTKKSKKSDKFKSKKGFRSKFPKRKKKSFRFFRKKPFRRNKTDKCYLCGERGHFSKNCPNKKEKSAKLASQVLHIQSADTDVESIYSEQEIQNSDTVFAIHDTSSEDEGSDHSLTDVKYSLPVYTIESLSFSSYLSNDISSALVMMPPRQPHAQVKILSSKYAKPIPVIAFFDTGAYRSMMNSDILPPKYGSFTGKHSELLMGKCSPQT